MNKQQVMLCKVKIKEINFVKRWTVNILLGPITDISVLANET